MSKPDPSAELKPSDRAIAQAFWDFVAETQEVPCGHESPGRGQSTYNWRRYAERVILDRARALDAAQQQTMDAAPNRFVVLKAIGSRYAYVNDTLRGRTVERYNILKGVGKRNGWSLAKARAKRLNDAAMRGGEDKS